MNEETATDLPETLPVMVLPGVTLFPNALLPLHIFEPRYRAMLEESLDSRRMLAIAMPRDEGESELEPVAGAGLVRACVRNGNGTSNLILQGVSRIRFTGWEQLEPFRIARIEEVVTRPIPGPEGEENLAHLVTRLHALCSRFKEKGIELPPQFEAYLDRIPNIGVITDLVASALLADPAVRQSLLEETEIPRRLEKLLEGLRNQLS
jgi:Lon protease-like protein